MYAISLVLFLLPGCAITAVIAARRQMRLVHALIFSISASATLGYVAFWFYLASKLAGEIFSYGVIFSSAGLLAVTLSRAPTLKSLAKHMAPPFIYVLVIGLFYSYLFFLFSNPLKAHVDLPNFRFFQEVRPGDNLIPLFFAEKIYDRQPVSPVCCGDWLSSDRPPLQAGIFLLQRPLRLFGNTGLQYQLLATALQCLWIPGVCVLLWALGASCRRTKQVLGFFVFSGFLFYNSVYTWPKLLAATFILFVASILLEASANAALTFFETLLAALCFSLALLAHSGAVFSTPGLLLLLLAKRVRLSLRTATCGVLLIAFFLMPWVAYQKFYDPPGNRLLKMHLAGVGQIDSRSTWQAIRDAYESRSLPTLLRYKWSNLRTMIGPYPAQGFGPAEIVDATRLHPRASESSRMAQREYIWNAIGIVNAGSMVAFMLLVRRKKQRTLPHAGLLVAMAVLNLIAWCVAVFGPNQTFTTTSSYGDVVLLSIGLLGFLLALHRAAVFSLWILELLNFTLVWARVKPARLTLSNSSPISPESHWPLLIASLICALGLLWHFGRSYLKSVD